MSAHRSDDEGGTVKGSGFNSAYIADQEPSPVQCPGAASPVTLTLDTAAYADGDVLSDTVEITGAVQHVGGVAVLQSVTVYDEDDQGMGIRLWFFSSNVSLGTKNSAPNISDANARECLGYVDIEASRFVDLGGVRVASRDAIGKTVKAAAASRSIWMSSQSLGTGTYTAAGVRVRAGFI